MERSSNRRMRYIERSSAIFPSPVSAAFTGAFSYRREPFVGGDTRSFGRVVFSVFTAEAFKEGYGHLSGRANDSRAKMRAAPIACLFQIESRHWHLLPFLRKTGVFVDFC